MSMSVRHSECCHQSIFVCMYYICTFAVVYNYCTTVVESFVKNLSQLKH